MKKLGAWSIIVGIASGLFMIGSSVLSSVAAWTETQAEIFHLKGRVQSLENKNGKIDQLFKLNCKIAIYVIKDKKVTQEICSEN